MTGTYIRVGMWWGGGERHGVSPFGSCRALAEDLLEPIYAEA